MGDDGFNVNDRDDHAAVASDPPTISLALSMHAAYEWYVQPGGSGPLWTAASLSRL